jgi:hypothetical protein
MKKAILLLNFFVTTCLFGQSFDKQFMFNSAENATEQAFAGISLSNGNYLIGANNYILCLNANGDSLWNKKYVVDNIEKFFRDPNGNLMVAAKKGRIIVMQVNESNGDSVTTFTPPGQVATFNYNFYDIVVNAAGKYFLSYNQGGGDASIVTCFTPGATTPIWKLDFAGQSYHAKGLLIEDTTLIMAGYQRIGANSNANLQIRKYGIVGSQLIWQKSMFRSSSYVDRLVGLQKNANNEFLVATTFGFESDLVATIAKFSNTGDSLAVHIMKDATYKGGFLHSLTQSGDEFIAGGVLVKDTVTPSAAKIGYYSMGVFKVATDGRIVAYAAFNKIGLFKISANSYDASQCLGKGAFKTADNHYLVYGEGGMLRKNINYPEYFETSRRTYVAKTNQLTSVGTSTLVEKINKENLALSLYPNPATEEINITLTAPSILKLYGINGNLIWEKEAEAKLQNISIADLSTGIYLLSAQSKDGIVVKYLVKQ